jgi:hypothetical protein
MSIIAIVVSCCVLKTIGGLTLVCAYQTCTTLQIKYYLNFFLLNSKYTNVMQLLDFFHNLLKILGMKKPIQFQISKMKFPYKVDLIYQLESMWIYLMVL